MAINEPFRLVSLDINIKSIDPALAKGIEDMLAIMMRVAPPSSTTTIRICDMNEMESPAPLAKDFVDAFLDAYQSAIHMGKHFEHQLRFLVDQAAQVEHKIQIASSWPRSNTTKFTQSLQADLADVKEDIDDVRPLYGDAHRVVEYFGRMACVMSTLPRADHPINTQEDQDDNGDGVACPPASAHCKKRKTGDDMACPPASAHCRMRVKKI